MSKANYGVYHYDTIDEKIGAAIISGVGINRADREAKQEAQREAEHYKTAWSKAADGDNCIFHIGFRRMGFIVKKESEQQPETCNS